jgi:hypothetical protein
MQVQVSLDPAATSARVESQDGRFVAEFLGQSSGWMAGTILGKSFADDDERQAFAAGVFDSLQEVGGEEQKYSTCTDGRKRVKLEDGAAVPVREQLVGTDTMCAFVAAEALGAHFYGEDLYKDVDVRIRRVVQHLLDSGYRPTAHIACGAAGGFTTVINRATQFIKDHDYVARLQRLSDGSYNATQHHLIVGSYQSRLVSGVYEGYRDGLVAEIVLEMVGPQAVEYYDDDGRGVHGHRELAIVYLDQTMQGLAINPNGLIAATDGQVFGINSSRIDALARVMSADDNRGIDYLTARLAIEDFSAAGHGTLAAQMETMVVSRKA